MGVGDKFESTIKKKKLEIPFILMFLLRISNL